MSQRNITQTDIDEFKEAFIEKFAKDGKEKAAMMTELKKLEDICAHSFSFNYQKALRALNIQFLKEHNHPDDDKEKDSEAAALNQ